MSLVSVQDVSLRLGRELTASETARVPGLSDEAEALVGGHLGCDISVPAPKAVVLVASRMVARVLAQDASGSAAIGVAQVSMTAGPFSRQQTMQDGSGSGAPWLERSDKVKLRPYRCGGGMVSVGLTSEQR